MNNSFSTGPQLIPDDGLATTSAEPWFKEKIKTMIQYIDAYTVNMSYRTHELMLIDLFSGNGIYTLGEQRGNFTGFNLSILSREPSYNKFCFCTTNAEDARALRIRINKWYKDKNVLLLEGERADLVNRLKLYVPKSNVSFKVGSICVIDAFSLRIDYVWLDLLAEYGFDFLLVFTFPLNEYYNWQYYLKEERSTLSKFLGAWNALEKLEKASHDNLSFYKKLFELHQQDMKLLGYDCAMHSHKFDSGLMNIPMYYTASFTRHISARMMQKELGESTQMGLFNSEN